MSSPTVPSTSTPLYRVFRGLKSTQVIAVPSTEAEWLVALNDFKSIYLAGRWKECETKCTRLLEAAKNKPVIHPYLLFLIGSCVEIHARNMHQYSSGKGKKIKEAADWFERCEKALPLAMAVPCVEPTADNPLLHTPVSRQGLGVGGVDDSPLTAFGERGRLGCFPLTPRDEEQSYDNHYSLRRRESLVSSRSDMSVDVKIPLSDETDPFVSLTPESDSGKGKLDNWSIPPPPNFELSPLRIRKVDSGRTSKNHGPETPRFTTIPSPLSQASSTNGICWYEDDESKSPLRGLEVQNNEDNEVYDYESFEKWHLASTRYHYFDDDNFFRRDMNNAVNVTTSPTLSFKYESFHSDSGRRTTLEREDSSLWFKYHCSSLKPSPLRIRPKKTQAKADGSSDSDSTSLARLQRSWEISSFQGTYATDSDAHSLHAVESTWAPLLRQYHASLVAENERLQALRARITRYNNHLNSLSNQLQETVRYLRQLAMDIDLNRTTHIEARRIQPTKSYWSFAVKNDSGNSGDAENGDDYDEHRDKPEMKTNLAWAAPGTILNETREERIKRLRAGNFETVGMQNEKRGHKGRSWYLDLCEEVLDDIEGLMRGVH
ncbi:hypothetical protein PISL3812_01564 [Talaromyces islandicus]|uniref:Uncharacterized protein n=1 Tax=Talaromyces islandicus TaxID=28573 RepID=A0A0U1LP69_TALIS|nr:hypothetical protein PISL3812_01564 [Talaromyces islandicus]